MTSGLHSTTRAGSGPDDLTRLGSDVPAGSTSRFAPNQSFGPFRILRELGRGGMGEVYEAEQVDSGRRVALKTLSRSFSDREARDRFLREGRLAASVSHPNSVYVYGSHDVDGVPAISMELVSGGTLDALVAAKGPLRPAQAAAMTLQLIDGLEAAEAHGVLHRDIKPSNAFIDPSGTVKIGDYGLSLSLGTTDETRLTTAGMFLGTPMYASPEQVRGHAIDVRSDIYAVGATLYFLLTGRPPFERPNAVQVLAAVVADVPESPRKWSPEVPDALAEVVLRCLRKDPASRFQTYDALRLALEPFSGLTRLPARRLRRIGASLIDLLIFVPFTVPVSVATRNSGLSGALLSSLFGFVIQVGYFAWFESRYGASIGKRAQGLRVVATSGAPISFARSAVRASVWFWILSIGDIVQAVWPDLQWDDSATRLGVLGLLFVTARKRNGYLGLHEIVSGTRTVAAAPTWSLARRRERQAPAAAATAAQGDVVGEFLVRGRLWEADGEALDAGWDSTLERAVWIHHVPLETPPVPEDRQRLARASRLRWLDSRRSPTENWDAFEAPEGHELGVMPWNEALVVMKDLALECERAVTDGSLPSTLSLDQIWVPRTGAARITEFPVVRSGTTAGANTFAVRDAESAQRFVHAAGAGCLGGDLSTVPLPLSVRAAIDEVGKAKLPSLQAVVELLGDASRSAPVVSKATRWLSFGPAGVVFVIALVVALNNLVAAYRLHEQPHIETLGLLSARLLYLSDEGESPETQWMSRHPARRYTEDERRAFRMHVGDRYSAAIADPDTWTMLDPYWDDENEMREAAENARQEALAASPEARARASVEAARVIDDFDRRQAERASFWIDQLLRLQPTIASVLAFVGFVAVIAAIVTRGSLVLRAFGLGIAGPDGRRASWLRAALRTIVAWSPALVGYTSYQWLGTIDLHAVVAPSVLLATNLAMVGGCLLSAWQPDLSPHDRILGTRVVPR